MRPLLHLVRAGLSRHADPAANREHTASASYGFLGAGQQKLAHPAYGRRRRCRALSLKLALPSLVAFVASWPFSTGWRPVWRGATRPASDWFPDLAQATAGH